MGAYIMKLMKFTIGCICLAVYFFVGFKGLLFYLGTGLVVFVILYGLLRSLGEVLALFMSPPSASITVIFILAVAVVPQMLSPNSVFIAMAEGIFEGTNTGAEMGFVMGGAVAFHVFFADFWNRDIL